MSRGLRAFAEFTTGAVDNTVELSWFDINRESNGDFGPSEFDGDRLRARYLGGADVGADGRLAFGADYTRESASDSFGFDGDNSVAGVFGEFTWSPGPQLDGTFALRFDEHSEFGSYLTGRVALAYRPSDDWTFRTSIGTGFRAPSTYELFSAFGDPTLEPEESLSADIGVEKTFANGASLQATAFYLEVDSLIDFDFAAVACGSGFGCYAQIPGVSKRSGVEVLGAFPLGENVEISGSYTYTDSSSNASSAWARVPRHALMLAASAEFSDRWSGAVSLRHAADRQAGLDDYTVLDAALHYEVRPGMDAYLRVENITDEQYQLVPGYGTSDRAIYVGLRSSF